MIYTIDLWSQAYESLETERLLLKPVEESDLPLLLELQWDKEVVKHMKFSPLSMENQKTWIKSLGKNSLAFTINIKKNNQLSLLVLSRSIILTI